MRKKIGLMMLIIMAIAILMNVSSTIAVDSNCENGNHTVRSWTNDGGTHYRILCVL